MNVTTLEAPATPALGRAGSPTPALSTQQRSSGTTPTTTPLRPGRRTGRGTGPEARPARRPPRPSLVRGPASGTRSCAASAPAPEPVAVPATRWRLTDRGIALVLVTGLLIATAALAVVALTALRVTGDRYSAVQAVAVHRAA